MFGRELSLAEKGESCCISLAFQECFHVVASGLGRSHQEKKTLESVSYHFWKRSSVSETRPRDLSECLTNIQLGPSKQVSCISIYCGLGDQALAYLTASFFSNSQREHFWPFHNGCTLHRTIKTLPTEAARSHRVSLLGRLLLREPGLGSFGFRKKRCVGPALDSLGFCLLEILDPHPSGRRVKAICISSSLYPGPAVVSLM